MGKLLKEEIVSVDSIAEGIVSMGIYSEHIAETAKPGQFLNIKCSEGLSTLLRRPISICRIDSDKKQVYFVFQVKGTGTSYLSQKRPGEMLDIMGPLGNPFDVDEGRGKRIAVIGGGIGTFPLLNLLEASRAEVKDAYIGFRNAEAVVLKKEFTKASTNLYLCTDDGSAGHKGFVTDLLIQKIIESTAVNKYDVIYACGPYPMLKKSAIIAENNNIPCQVSMEQRMGCGIGACLVCACKSRKSDEADHKSCECGLGAGKGSQSPGSNLQSESDSWEYSHVCKDGPVYWSREVIWDE